MSRRAVHLREMRLVLDQGISLEEARRRIAAEDHAMGMARLERLRSAPLAAFSQHISETRAPHWWERD